MKPLRALALGSVWALARAKQKKTIFVSKILKKKYRFFRFSTVTQIEDPDLNFFILMKKVRVTYSVFFS